MQVYTGFNCAVENNVVAVVGHGISKHKEQRLIQQLSKCPELRGRLVGGKPFSRHPLVSRAIV